MQHIPFDHVLQYHRVMKIRQYSNRLVSETRALHSLVYIISMILFYQTSLFKDSPCYVTPHCHELKEVYIISYIQHQPYPKFIHVQLSYISTPVQCNVNTSNICLIFSLLIYVISTTQLCLFSLT
ncbi:hypothetical protein F4677DRAFT_96518 [Hypoxylon crocopeplum]|nr:hypothetical protein F4677DRAFT_96518 [Hypoxylon crocopeplum]